MSLRNKITILSFTLMSLLTIPTLAENDNAPVNSRIENSDFDVQIKIPEGWSETQDFSHTVPDQFEIGGMLYKGITFRNGSELHGCAVFLGVDADDEDFKSFDKTALEKAFAEVQEKTFPDTQMPIYSLEKLTTSAAAEVDLLKDSAKFNVNAAAEVNQLKSGVSKKISVSGNLSGNTGGTLVIGSGKLTAGDDLCMYGSVGVMLDNDYQLCVVAWGSDEATLRNDVQNFVKATVISKKAPASDVNVNPIAVKVTVTTTVETVNEPTTDIETSAPAAVEAPVAFSKPVKPIVSENTVKAEPSNAVEAPTPSSEAVKPIVTQDAVKAEPATAFETPIAVKAPTPSSEAVKPIVTEDAVKAELTTAFETPIAVKAPAASSEAVKPIVTEDAVKAEPATAFETPTVVKAPAVSSEVAAEVAKPTGEAVKAKPAPVSSEAVSAAAEVPSKTETAA